MKFEYFTMEWLLNELGWEDTESNHTCVAEAITTIPGDEGGILRWVYIEKKEHLGFAVENDGSAHDAYLWHLGGLNQLAICLEVEKEFSFAMPRWDV